MDAKGTRDSRTGKNKKEKIGKRLTGKARHGGGQMKSYPGGGLPKRLFWRTATKKST